MVFSYGLLVIGFQVMEVGPLDLTLDQNRPEPLNLGLASGAINELWDD
ncbi:MAG: hypothetical protein ACFBSC_01675 [Microcoleaceae cyanobacterium]